LDDRLLKPGSEMFSSSEYRRTWILDEMVRELFLVTTTFSTGVEHKKGTDKVTDECSLQLQDLVLPPTSMSPHYQESTVAGDVINHYFSGMIISWINPAGLISDQKRVMMALSPCNFTTQVMMSGDKMAVIHLLSSDQLPLVPLFGSGHGPVKDKFQCGKLVASSVGTSSSSNDEPPLFTYNLWEPSPGSPLTTTKTPLPVVQGTLGYIVVKIVSSMNVGDRIIAVADVVEEKMLNDDNSEKAASSVHGNLSDSTPRNHQPLLVGDVTKPDESRAYSSEQATELYQEFISHKERDRALRASFHSCSQIR
jgi:flavin reductase (DIM6/NTAB) family NADH-FMN oxidoreductase RutF